MEPLYALVVVVLRMLMTLGFRWRMQGSESIPRTGAVIFACNHISYFDPLAHGYFLVHHRRRLRFFAKAELWRSPVLGPLLRRLGQIPVERGSGELGPVAGAMKALALDEAVVIYPEATITTTADLMPMPGKTGAARVALASGAPVIPVAVWGSQWVSPKGRVRTQRLGRSIFVKAGPVVPLSDLAGRPEDPDALREATDRIMQALEQLVRDLQRQHPLGATVPRLLPAKASKREAA